MKSSFFFVCFIFLFAFAHAQENCNVTVEVNNNTCSDNNLCVINGCCDDDCSDPCDCCMKFRFNSTFMFEGLEAGAGRTITPYVRLPNGNTKLGKATSVPDGAGTVNVQVCDCICAMLCCDETFTVGYFFLPITDFESTSITQTNCDVVCYCDRICQIPPIDPLYLEDLAMGDATMESAVEVFIDCCQCSSSCGNNCCDDCCDDCCGGCCSNRSCCPKKSCNCRAPKRCCKPCVPTRKSCCCY